MATKWQWLIESKYSLLLFGAITTGLVVPWLQYTQQTMSWIRENRQSYLQHHLETTRDSLKEVVALHALVVEGYQDALLSIRTFPREKSSFAKYYARVAVKRSKLSQQMGRFVGTWCYFSEDEQKALGAAFQRYEVAMRSLWIELDQEFEAKIMQSTGDHIKRNMSIVNAAPWAVAGKATNNAYKDVIRIIEQRIERLEDESLSHLTLFRH